MKKRVLALALVLVMVLGLAACGKDKGDPNEIIIGDYTAYYTRSEFVTDYDGDDAIAIYLDFTNNSDEVASFIWSLYYTAKQNDVELEQATVFLSEDSFETLFDTSMEDVAPGETLEVALTYKLADKTAPVEIEFSDLFERETDHLTIDPATVGAESASAPAGDAAEGDAVTYKATSMITEGEELGEEMLSMMGDCYVTFHGDGTAVMDLFDEVFALDYDGEEFTMMGVSFADYTLDGDTLTFEMEGMEFVLTKTDEAYEVPAVTETPEDFEEEKIGYAFDAEFAAGYAGDWHGVAEFYDCTGDYSDEDEMQCDIAARLVFDEDGRCTPYIRLCLDQPEEENLIVESLDYDEEYDCILINGTLNGKPLDPVESFIELEGDDVLYIGAAYDDGSGDVFKFLGCLRRLDDQWDYENDYPYIVQEGVDFYMGMSFEERIELFGYDTSLIPELSGNVGSDVQEEAPAEDAGEGVVELQQLKDWKAWHSEVNSYENGYYKPSIDECVEAMGVEPAAWNVEKWEEDVQIFKWVTADGKDHIILTIKPDDDGTWRYHSFSWSSGVNG